MRSTVMIFNSGAVCDQRVSLTISSSAGARFGSPSQPADRETKGVRAAQGIGRIRRATAGSSSTHPFDGDAIALHHRAMSRRLAVLALLCCATLVNAKPPGQVTDATWPQLEGRVGPYGGIRTPDDARQMLGDGLTLAVVAGLGVGPAAVLRAGGGRYVDAGPWERIHAACQRQYAVQDASRTARNCTLTQTDQDAIAAQIADQLRLTEGDAALAGFWILDDDPHGDITAMLARIRALVGESNARSHFNRPTICGVGGSLDHKRRADDASFAPDRQAMVQALRNVSPAGCDLVSPYFYGTASADDPSMVDWSMRDLLPFFELALQGRGYASPSDVLLPLVDAFSSHQNGSASYYVKPRSDDILAQMRAYCDTGAFAVLFFTWQSNDADRSYANDEELRAGVLRGRAYCSQQWRKPRATDSALPGRRLKHRQPRGIDSLQTRDRRLRFRARRIARHQEVTLPLSKLRLRRGGSPSAKSALNVSMLSLTHAAIAALLVFGYCTERSIREGARHLDVGVVGKQVASGAACSPIVSAP